MEVSDIVDAKGLSRFVKSRQNSDGGYTFARRLYGLEFPSSISETYFALSILSILKENVQHREKTLSYVKKISRGKELHSSPATAFYAISSFLLLGERPPHSASLVEWLRAAITEKRAMFNEPTSNWFSAEYYADDSPFRSLFYAAGALQLLGKRVEKEDLIWLEQKREGGGFGFGTPDIVSTFYALSILSYAGLSFHHFKTEEFIEKCSVSSGGYAMVAGGAPAFVESTYFALASLSILGESPKDRQKHIKFLASLQDSEGGFRRSSEGGVLTLSNSYFALKGISILLGDENS